MSTVNCLLIGGLRVGNIVTRSDSLLFHSPSICQNIKNIILLLFTLISYSEFSLPKNVRISNLHFNCFSVVLLCMSLHCLLYSIFSLSITNFIGYFFSYEVRHYLSNLCLVPWQLMYKCNNLIVNFMNIIL